LIVLKTKSYPWSSTMEDSDDEFGFTNKTYRQSFHMTFEWPCLSFDVLRDDLGASRTQFPLTAYFVSATQANEEEEDAIDQIIVTKLSNLQCTRDDDDAADEVLIDPTIRCCAGAHPGSCTRIRAMPQQPQIIATWTETGSVMLWDIAAAINAANSDSGDGIVQSIFECPVEDTGFGLAFSRVSFGHLAVGQDRGLVTLWVEAGGSYVLMQTLAGHSASVEDIVWSPVEAGVLASCSGDGTIAVWDARMPGPSLQFTAHDTDVNVIDWNGLQPNLLCSGADDGGIRVWDLRAVDPTGPGAAAEIEYHQDPITSIEWNPIDETEFAVACEDGRVTIWDLSVEAADPDEREEGIPDQMMFEDAFDDPKELHYHPQIPGMVAVIGGEGFHVFIPAIETGDA
jgi:ribosome assembly protein RRB1